MKFPIEIGDPTIALIVTAASVLLVFAVYFIPSIIASRRRHPFRKLILVINVALALAGPIMNLILPAWAGSLLLSLAGSGIGWIALLAWSLLGRPTPAMVPARS